MIQKDNQVTYNFRLFCKTISNSATWGFDRFRLSGGRVWCTLIQIRRPDGSVLETKRFLSDDAASSFEHNFSFDLSENVLNEEYSVYIAGVVSGTYFQQCYAYPSGYSATYGRNAQITYWDLNEVSIGGDYSYNNNGRIKWENQPLKTLNGAENLLATVIELDNSVLYPRYLDRIITGIYDRLLIDPNNTMTLDYRNSLYAPTTRSSVARDWMIANGWNVTGSIPARTYKDHLSDRVIADGGTMGESTLTVEDNNESLLMLPIASKAGKLYSAFPENGDGDFTVDRNSTATYVAKDGLIKTAAVNEPRFDFSDGNAALLVEPQATNLVAYSEDFSDVSWAKDNSTVEASTETIISSSTSYKIIPNSTNTTQHRASYVLATNNGAYTGSVYAKASGYNFMEIRLYDNSGDSPYALFNLASGQIELISNCTAKIKSMGNGWYKCSVSADLIAFSLSNLQFWLYNQNTKAAYIGDGTSGVLLTGAQLETGSVATSYIPTAGSTVTRLQDYMSTPITLPNNFLNNNGCTVFIDIDYLALSDGNWEGVFSLKSTTTSDSIMLMHLNQGTSLYLDSKVEGGVLEQGYAASANTISEGRHKIALRVQTQLSGNTSINVFVNGVYTGGKDLSGLMQNLNEIILFQGKYGNSKLRNIKTKSFKVIPTALTDPQLITLTTI